MELSGSGLTTRVLAAAVEGECPVELAPEGLQKMAASRRIVEAAVASGDPVYGLTTGLGARVTEALPEEALSAFSYQTLRGRAHAVGEPLPVRQVRAAMLVRLNTLLSGYSGASPAIADHLCRCFNAGLTPIVPESASIGASDLCWNATLGLALIGEGRMQDASGRSGESSSLMGEFGINPPKLGPKDGLALANHSSFSAALVALGMADAETVLEAAQAAAAMSLEGFRANLSPLESDVLNARPQPGQTEAADSLLLWLEGSSLHTPGTARRLQDPLSIRNLVQVHGAAYAALAFGKTAAEAELNGASDNPVVLTGRGEIRSSGGYHTPLLTLAAETASRAIAQLATCQVARMSKLLTERFSGLPLFLAQRSADSNGLSPVMKVAEALLAKIHHLASPVPITQSANADGVEDLLTNAPLAARNLLWLTEKARFLGAIELLVAAQAIDLAGIQPAPRLQEIHRKVRKISPMLEEDRPLAEDITRLADVLIRQRRIVQAQQ